ncbi:unnamed protein product [Nesidiocoris tenuis]|uniref:Uncharacterized protein n=1 Tax=Nesidiocoris tenuis TaxID=355587 RepID=A0A6H5G651_9HEMI|nr:unnamed protein product [Nesidiocoris tenuis]
MCKNLQGIQQVQKIQNRFSRTPSNWQKREKGEIATGNFEPNRLKNNIFKHFRKKPLFYVINHTNHLHQSSTPPIINSTNHHLHQSSTTPIINPANHQPRQPSTPPIIISANHQPHQSTSPPIINPTNHQPHQSSTPTIINPDNHHLRQSSTNHQLHQTSTTPIINSTHHQPHQSSSPPIMNSTIRQLRRKKKCVQLFTIVQITIRVHLLVWPTSISVASNLALCKFEDYLEGVVLRKGCEQLCELGIPSPPGTILPSTNTILFCLSLSSQWHHFTGIPIFTRYSRAECAGIGMGI